MNALADKFGNRVAILGFPCNQFGHQTNEGNEEFLNTLKYVRPGNGFEPKFDVFGKVNVNGKDCDPLWKALRTAIRAPMDADQDSKGNGALDSDVLILHRGGFDATTVATWSPVCRSDVAWNFEKFVLDSQGVPVKRYSRYYDTMQIAADLEALLK
mmetsp:Transcript_11340/g.38655  ORF Transcript_11340/g.38655 Transcript_11340/m.38655 type:complete len:156 (+) Transcript_11340:282-749(+)